MSNVGYLVDKHSLAAAAVTYLTGIVTVFYFIYFYINEVLFN